MSDLESSSPERNRPPVVHPFEPAAAAPGGLDEEMIVVAEAVVERPPLWPTFLTALIAIGGALIASGIVMGIAGLVWGGVEVFRGTREFNDWLMSFLATEMGLAVLVLPGQLTFCAVALVAAMFSREKPADRLGLRRGNFPLWTWPLFLLGTPVVGMVMAQLMSLVIREPSEQLQLLENLFETHAAGSLAMLLLLISVLPGFIEELLFRGFMQRRLLARLPVVAAIGITTAFFAAAHLDPMHAIGVMPLGIWLGVIAWRADSIWPAVFGHVGNNAYAIVMSVMMGESPDRERIGPEVVATMGLTLVAFVGCLVLLAVRRPKTPPRGDSSARSD
jgi:membrane protease YdiL (CAAX protease family)